ncbi:MAG: HprK-related kinase B, partial [Candidatus Methylomirabilis sp.]|nr:HprK-related kinase B [Deltaproteobacteria bacterium]
MSLAASISKVSRSLVDGREPTERLDFDFAECRVRLETNSADLARKLARYYRDFLARDVAPDITVTAIEAPEPKVSLPLNEKHPEPGKRKVKEEFIDLEDGRLIRKRLTGLVFLIGRGGGSHLAVGPCAANDNQIVNFINNRY